jgi:hypothetical protein
LTTKLQLVEQPSEPERVAAENLKPGQFLAAGALTTGRPTEVLFTDTYPQRLGRETLIVHRPLGVDYSIASIVGGNHWFAVAAEADLAAMHKQAEREQLANELRRLAEMILNPAMPVPQYGISMYASFKTGAEVRAAAEVFSLPVESRKPNAGIQTPEWPQDRKSYEQGIHLHWLTITDESGPSARGAWRVAVDEPDRPGLHPRPDDEADDPDDADRSARADAHRRHDRERPGRRDAGVAAGNGILRAGTGPRPHRRGPPEVSDRRDRPGLVDGSALRRRGGPAAALPELPRASRRCRRMPLMAAETCPAALPLCPCGIRGCDRAAEHVALYAPRRRHWWRRR